MSRSLLFCLLLAPLTALAVTGCSVSRDASPGRASDDGWRVAGEAPDPRLAGRGVTATEDAGWRSRSAGPATSDDSTEVGSETAGSPPAELVAAVRPSGPADGGASPRRKARATAGTLSESGLGSGAFAMADAPAELERDRGSDDDRAYRLPRRQVRQALRAGSTDDNAEFDKFVEFVGGWARKPWVRGHYQPLDVRGRRYIRVVDAAGAPLPGAAVRVLRAGRTVWTATTYGDGRAPFYPGIATPDLGVGRQGQSSLTIEATFGHQTSRTKLNGRSSVAVALDTIRPDREIALDVLFLLDTTGSMSDEIDRIKDSLLMVTESVRELDVSFDLRYGAVLYRDIGDAYLTRIRPFTRNINAFDRALRGVTADGGGDTPESLNQGLAVAVSEADWRDGAAKVVFLIADAPPHMDYDNDIPYGDSLQEAVAKGIKIHAVAASGLDEVGTLVFRQIAQYSRGKFIFIEYGSTAASAAAHGVSGSVTSNNLDRILYSQIRDELLTWAGQSARQVAGLRR